MLEYQFDTSHVYHSILLLTLLQLVPVVQMAVAEPDGDCLWQFRQN